MQSCGRQFTNTDPPMSNQQFLHYLFLYCADISWEHRNKKISLLMLSGVVARDDAKSLPVIILRDFTTSSCDVTQKCIARPSRSLKFWSICLYQRTTFAAYQRWGAQQEYWRAAMGTSRAPRGAKGKSGSFWNASYLSADTSRDTRERNAAGVVRVWQRVGTLEQ